MFFLFFIIVWRFHCAVVLRLRLAKCRDRDRRSWRPELRLDIDRGRYVALAPSCRSIFKVSQFIIKTVGT